MGVRDLHHWRVRRRAFTLVEVVVASVVCAMIAAATATAIGQIARVKEKSLARRQAGARADGAAARIAMDALSAVRHHDLRFAKVQVMDGGAGNDELVVLTRSLRRVRGADTAPEGGVYEAQYRIGPGGPDGAAPTLWRRVDPAFDPALDGGGVAEPAVVGVRSLSVQASDGEAWFDAWDSDTDGLPHGLRVTVEGVSDDGSVTAVARRVIALDQVPVPTEAEAAEDAGGGASSAPTGGAGSGDTTSGGGGMTTGGSGGGMPTTRGGRP